jgi:hypothetical protein
MRLPAFRRLLLTAASASALVVVFAQSALADPRDFQLQNTSAVDIASVYVSPSDLNSWGDDVMGRDILPAGNAVNLTFGGFDGTTCTYDIKVLGTGGQEGYLYKVDLCSVTSVTFS